MPRHYGRTGRRKRPLDQILNPELPTSPQATATVGTTGNVTGPVDSSALDTMLGDLTTRSETITGAEENPWVNPFMEVYEATEAGALRRLDKRQKEMATKFAHRGGYFGGKHAIAQGEMEAGTGAYLDQLLAETQLGASERQYQDWLRSRGETMNLMNLIPTLIGSETFQNIVQMPGQGKGGALGSLVGAGAGSVLGPMGATVGSGVGENIVGSKGSTN